MNKMTELRDNKLETEKRITCQYAEICAGAGEKEAYEQICSNPRHLHICRYALTKRPIGVLK